ncbi:hypothetical protein [Glaciecola sp. 33A]|jgi:hypothetical protein|uniref:hypothetical protein n=1 Tax=Glaciecola sp. 33A TaxID=2057807 RepID=UPI000C349EB1|nr:hypothetical protein [Glaciecola sp. 33A]PKI02538.1 hypothetical protein CXF81_05710 [Glaciecola sp. 33A]
MTGMDWFGISASAILSIIALIDLWRINTSLKSKLLTSLLLVFPILGVTMYLILRPDIKKVRHSSQFNHYYGRGYYYPYQIMKTQLKFAKENANKIGKEIDVGLSIWPSPSGDAELISKNVASVDIDRAFDSLSWEDICFVTLVKDKYLWLEVSGSHSDGFCAKLVKDDGEFFIEPPPSSPQEMKKLIMLFYSDSQNFIDNVIKSKRQVIFPNQ